MTDDTRLESEHFFLLLTDALRAGPGSPQWHQAVKVLREQGANGDEYAMLCKAREHLASGKDYRTVRAGPGFTAKVMTGIEKEDQGGRPGGLPMANIIAIAAAIVIVAVLAIVGFVLLSSTDPQRSAVDELARIQWTGSPAAMDLDSPINDQWRTIGSLSLATDQGLQATGAGGTQSYKGGGIVLKEAIPADEMVCLTVGLKLRKLSDDLVVQVFCSDTPRFSDETAMSGHELVCLLQDAKPKVILPDTRIAAEGDKLATPAELLPVTLKLSRTAAIVDIAGQRLWAGEHQLDPKAPRYLGVRFLSRGGKGEQIVVRSLAVQPAAK